MTLKGILYSVAVGTIAGLVIGFGTVGIIKLGVWIIS